MLSTVLATAPLAIARVLLTIFDALDVDGGSDRHSPPSSTWPETVSLRRFGVWHSGSNLCHGANLSGGFNLVGFEFFLPQNHHLAALFRIPHT